MLSTVSLAQVEQQGGLPQPKQIETERNAGRPPPPPPNVNECSRSSFYQSAEWTVAEFLQALGGTQTPLSQDKQADKKQAVRDSFSLLSVARSLARFGRPGPPAGTVEQQVKKE